MKPSLYFNTAVDTTEDDPSGQILRPLDNLEVIPVNIDDSYDKLKQTDITGQISDGQTLLILGEPGSGKTIALLQLAKRLIEQTQQDMTKPIPVIFNLSSWGEKQQPLEEWLIEELKDKYQVPKAWSKPWIKDQQLTLLLDGLDEVKAEHRNACVRAINKFIADYYLETEIVVCSRIKDYEALVERLLLNSSICIQPLSKLQLLDFLENADDSLLGLKSVIEQDDEIAEFAQTPLILNMMTWTYQGWSEEQCQIQFRIAANRKFNLFESYIEKNLAQENKAEKYSEYQILEWLIYLGKRMAQESKIIFLIEKLQPNLLQSRISKIIYRAGNFLLIFRIVGLTVGVTDGIIYSMVRGSINWPIYGVIDRLIEKLFLALIEGFITGLIYGLIYSLIAEYSPEIKLFEQMSWSWQRAKSKVTREISLGLIFGILAGFLTGLIFGIIRGISLGIIYGLILGLIVDLLVLKLK